MFARPGQSLFKRGGRTVVRGAPAIGGGGALPPAPVLVRLTATTSYPPQLDFTRPVELIDGDVAVLERTQDVSFGSGITTAEVPLTAATTTYDFGLSAVVAGSWFFRMRFKRAGAVISDWSNIVNVGDTAAPVLSSATTATYAERTLLAHPVTANEPFTLTVVGGAQASAVEVAGTGANWILRLAGNAPLDFEALPNIAVTLRLTDYAGNAADSAISITVGNVTENPAAFTFTPVTGATPGQSYTSETRTISGLPAGYAAPYALTGSGFTVVRNGLAAPASGTVVNGDTVALTGTAPGTTNASAASSLSTGGDNPAMVINWSIATVMVLPTPAEWKLLVDPSVAGSIYQGLAASGALAAAQGDTVGYVVDQSPNLFDMSAPSNAARPTLDLTGGYPGLQFDGVDDYLRRLASIGGYAAGACTHVFAIKSAATGNTALVSENSSTTDTPSYLLSAPSGNPGTVAVGLRNDAYASAVFSSTNILTGTNALAGADRVIVVVDTGTSMTAYVDGVAWATRTYARSGTLTVNRFALMAQLRTSASAFASGKLYFYGQIQRALTAGEVAQATTYAAAKQGRSI